MIKIIKKLKLIALIMLISCCSLVNGTPYHDLRNQTNIISNKSIISSISSWLSDPSAESWQPTAIISKLKEEPKLKNLFEQSARVNENNTIEKHTVDVLERFNQCKENINLPEQVTKKDFMLFLSLHYIGKSIAKHEATTGVCTAASAASYNQKDLELLYSRSIFKQIARELGIKPATIKILSRLLHSDAIGDYLKDINSSQATFNLLVRDGAKCELAPKIFFNLHKIFHQIKLDAKVESDPKLQEKISTLENIFTQLADTENRMQASITKVSDDDKVQQQMSSDELPSNEQYIALLYALRLQRHYGILTEEQTRILENLKKLDDTKISIYFPAVNYQQFKAELKKLKDPTENTALSAIHGVNSGVLIGLMRTSGTLYPTGSLTKLGITPLSGELKIGASRIGINMYSLSGCVPKSFKLSLEGYAKKFNVIGALDALKGEIKTFIDYSCNRPEVANQNIHDSKLTNFFISSFDLLQGFAFSIKQVKILAPEKYLELVDLELVEGLRDNLQKDITQFEEFKKTETYNTMMPKAMGGLHPDNYYFKRFTGYSLELQACLEAIDYQPAYNVTEDLLEFINEPFPILFATIIPWQINHSFPEVNFNGPLALGKDVPYIYVYEKNIKTIQPWIDRHVLSKKKPEVRTIESLYKVFSANT